MIRFNELRFSEDKESIDIDVAIEDTEMYPDYYIDRIVVEYAKNFSLDALSDYHYVLYEDLGVYSTRYKGSFKLSSLPASIANKWPSKIEDGLFYVYVECSCNGEPDESVSEDEMTTIGVVLDWESFYRMGLQLVKKVVNDCGNICEPKCGWADFIFRWQALKLGIATSDYSLINDMWDLIFNRRISASGTTGCGCK